MSSSTMTEGQDFYFLNKKTKSTPIENDYKISNNVLGLGINGKVVQCFSNETNEKFALKVNNSLYILLRLKMNNIITN